MNIVGVIKVEAGTVAGSAVIVAIILAAAAIKSIPDIQLPNGTKITWKYDGHGIEIESHPIVASKPPGVLTPTSIESLFIDAYTNQVKAPGFGEAAKERPHVTVYSQGESSMLSVFSKRDHKDVEIQYQIEQAGDQVIFVPKNFKATDSLEKK